MEKCWDIPRKTYSSKRRGYAETSLCYFEDINNDPNRKIVLKHEQGPGAKRNEQTLKVVAVIKSIDKKINQF
jgi:hypothetical protein